MARFFGPVGFGETVEVRPGVWEDVITEKRYFGDVVRNTRRYRDSSETVHDTVTVENTISIVADDFANKNIHAMRYVGYSGALWTVSSVESERPRLILRMGEVYNGPTPAATNNP